LFVALVEILGLWMFFLFMKVWCLCLACRTRSGHESASPLGACLGT
jgi:hypothetical protein